MGKVSLKYRPLNQKDRASVRLDYAPPIPHPTKPGKRLRYLTLDYGFVYGRKVRGKFTPYAPNLTKSQRIHNEAVLELCERKRSHEQNRLSKSDIYTPEEIKKRELQKNKGENFFDIYKRVESSREDHKYAATMKLLKQWRGEVILIGDIDRVFVEDFKQYLLNLVKDQTLKKNTASQYFENFRVVLRYCTEHRYIDPSNLEVKRIKPQSPKKEYLTSAEIDLLIKNRSKDELLYRATMFMILTGLRISDILKLEYSNLMKQSDGYYVSIIIKKGDKPFMFKINEDAKKYMGDGKDGLVFDGLDEGKHREELKNWCYGVGIKKTITWHKLRHTFAVHMLRETGNLLLLSRLLGHSDIKSTMAYADIVGEDINQALDDFTLEKILGNEMLIKG